MDPILKWAGGKKRVLDVLRPLIPWGRFTRVFEPFLGGGAFFFSLDHSELPPVVLSDSNHDLIRFYDAVASSASAVAVNACYFANKHSSVNYLAARELYNSLKVHRGPTMGMQELHAGLFLYLNKCGFNGLYRVNSKGEFNTPPNAASKWNPTHLELCRVLCPAQSPLRRVTLMPGDFVEVFRKIPPAKDDFLFCDPPYVPPHDGDGFLSYTRDGFSEAALTLLAAELADAGDRGALWMVTHRDTPFVRSLFASPELRANFTEYKAPRSVAADGSKRQPVKELCFRNYS